MNTFDPSNPVNGGNRERPAPGDPEAPFYPPDPPAGGQEQSYQHGYGYGYGYGYRPDMDPDGFIGQRGGWQWQPGWQPWARGGYYWHRRHNFWVVLLLVVLAILLIKPLLTLTFALAGLAFVILLFLLPFAILGIILHHYFGWRSWGGGWGRWHRW